MYKGLYRGESWKNAHRFGAVMRLHGRLKGERAQEAATTTAIVLATAALAQEAARRDYPDMTDTRTRKTGSTYSGAVNQGYKDGAAVSIQPAIADGEDDERLTG